MRRRFRHFQPVPHLRFNLRLHRDHPVDVGLLIVAGNLFAFFNMGALTGEAGSDAGRQAPISRHTVRMTRVVAIAGQRVRTGDGWSAGNVRRGMANRDPAHEHIVSDLGDERPRRGAVEDIKALIIVVIYKIDRLTKSLMDYSKLVEIF